MHKSWSRSVRAQWNSTRAPGSAVSVPSGFLVPWRVNGGNTDEHVMIVLVIIVAETVTVTVTVAVTILVAPDSLSKYSWKPNPNAILFSWKKTITWKPETLLLLAILRFFPKPWKSCKYLLSLNVLCQSPNLYIPIQFCSSISSILHYSPRFQTIINIEYVYLKTRHFRSFDHLQVPVNIRCVIVSTG